MRLDVKLFEFLIMGSVVVFVLSHVLDQELARSKLGWDLRTCIGEQMGDRCNFGQGGIKAVSVAVDRGHIKIV